MPYGRSIDLEPLRSLAFGSIGASYTAIGTPLANPARLISIKNLTNQTVLFSINGINDHEILPANGGIILDFMANKTHGDVSQLHQSTTVYAKHNGVAPGSGAVYVSVYYCKGD